MQSSNVVIAKLAGLVLNNDIIITIQILFRTKPCHVVQTGFLSCTTLLITELIFILFSFYCQYLFFHLSIIIPYLNSLSEVMLPSITFQVFYHFPFLRDFPPGFFVLQLLSRLNDLPHRQIDQKGRTATSRKYHRSQKKREFQEFPSRSNITEKSSKNEEADTFNEYLLDFQTLCIVATILGAIILILHMN